MSDRLRYMLMMLYLPVQNTYGAAIETLEQVGKVVDSLYAKVSSCLCTRVSVLISLVSTSFVDFARLSRLHDVCG